MRSWKRPRRTPSVSSVLRDRLYAKFPSIPDNIAFKDFGLEIKEDHSLLQFDTPLKGNLDPSKIIGLAPSVKPELAFKFHLNALERIHNRAKLMTHLYNSWTWRCYLINGEPRGNFAKRAPSRLRALQRSCDARGQLLTYHSDKPYFPDEEFHQREAFQCYFPEFFELDAQWRWTYVLERETELQLLRWVPKLATGQFLPPEILLMIWEYVRSDEEVLVMPKANLRKVAAICGVL